MTTIQELVEELNFVAEAAHLTTVFTVAGPATVAGLGESYEVDVAWAMGNVKRLPDRTTSPQMHEALVQAHPDRKGLGPKHPPKA